jgi:enterochelin esterase-like enzyme
MDLMIPAPSSRDGLRDVKLYLPPSYDLAPRARRYPVVYFLHGGPGWNGDWFQHGALRETLDALVGTGRLPEVIAIAPDGHGPGRRGRSLWINSWDGASRVEDILVHDVVTWADSALRTVPDARHRALVGISDGADAAVNLLLHHPDVFGACAGLSGRYRPHGPAGYEAIVGPPAVRDSVLRACSPLLVPVGGPARLAGHLIYFDAGVLDLTARDCVALHERFTSLGVRHESHLYIGWHEWWWWRGRLSFALRSIARAFGPGDRIPTTP